MDLVGREFCMKQLFQYVKKVPKYLFFFLPEDDFYFFMRNFLP